MRLISLVFAAVVALAAPQAIAQPFPSQPVRVVVPFPPGGGTDILVRLIQDKYAAKLGQPIVIDNRPGASGNIGAGVVAKSRPDGYSLIVQATIVGIYPSVFSNLPYDPLTDFAYIGTVAESPAVVVTNPNSKFKTIADLVAEGKARPLNFASAGVGSPQHLATERLSKLQWIAGRARAVHDAAEKERQNIVTLTKEIENTKKTAEAIREDFKRVMSDFSATFNRVIAALIGEDVSAGASFHGRTVQVNLTCRGDFTSAAIETIKILAFDLAVLASSIEGRGHHPRFLVHDGPREADMSAAIYRRFFILAREFERAAKDAEPNFQYIITTTEPPPDEIRQEPWLLAPVLDASTQEGRLLKVDL